MGSKLLLQAASLTIRRISRRTTMFIILTNTRIYELAPYRLATVAGGSFVAFIWTVFPYPLTDRSWLRKDLGRTIYILANYYSVVHSTVRSRINQTEGDMEDPTSPGRQLEKARRKIFGKLMLLLPSLHQHADWQKWEPSFGGKFPAEIYGDIIKRLTKYVTCANLVSWHICSIVFEITDQLAVLAIICP